MAAGLSEDEIMLRARELVGKTLEDVAAISGAGVSTALTKGHVGLAYEKYFGLKPNTSSAPDFAAAGIELKSVPMRKTSAGFRPKERTVIGQIDYKSLCPTPFATSHLEAKTRKILFIFYEWKPYTDMREFTTLRVCLWSRGTLDESILSATYDYVTRKVCAGEAHEISESHTSGVGACTKDSAAIDRSQPFSLAGARKRAFAFKPTFTSNIWHTCGAKPSVSIEGPAVDSIADFEQRVAASVNSFVGLSLREISETFQLQFATARKNLTSAVSRRLLGAPAGRARVKEFEKLGVTIKTVRVNASRLPAEHVSFRAMDFEEVISETWENSSFREEVSHIFFVVFEQVSRADDNPVLVGGFFWKPSDEELRVMGNEWSDQVDIIRGGDLRLLPRASSTKAVHVRPHGRDSRDTRPLPTGGVWVKSSFWLNREFIQEVIRPNLR